MDELQGHILGVSIEEEMRTAYIDYSMSVIVARALPDVRDGLKPVHRRVLYGMHELGLFANRPYKKSARIVGEVLGKYHPHGDTSVYDAMVRMAQPWSLRYPLVQGQGNFGSIDGDAAAAMRYTEVRLERAAEDMLANINKNAVVFRPNFDDSLKEPEVLPAHLPNLLLNGSSGIAVGMATNMPPHHMGEVIDGLVAYIEDETISSEALMQHIKAPDFPTGGLIYGYEGVRAAYTEGRGRIVMRGRARIEENEKNAQARIVVTEVPFMVNKAMMIEKTARLIVDKKLMGISDIRDESDRNGLRIVYELKKDAHPQVVLNNLYKQTALQSTFSVNNVALVDGRPALLNLADMVKHYIKHKHDVFVRCTQFDLEAYEKRLHILEGLLIALAHLDDVVKSIRSSASPEAAKEVLQKAYGLDEVQSQAILDMRLQKLTSIEREKTQKECDEVRIEVARLKAILASREKQMACVKAELLALKDKYGDARRTEIVMSSGDVSLEDVIPNEAVVITVSRGGYIKRTLASAYRRQRRGGVGARGADLKADDEVANMLVANNHDYILFFTEKGKMYWLRAYEIPEGSRTALGRSIQNVLHIKDADKVCTILSVKDLRDKDYLNNHYLFMATRKGIVKKTSLSAYASMRNDIRAIVFKDQDRLLKVALTQGDHEVMLATSEGLAVRFHEKDVRAMGRTARGVRGVRLASPSAEVIGMLCVKDKQTEVFVISERGYGKRSLVESYRAIKRGGKGVKALQVSPRTGPLNTILEVQKSDDLIITSASGTMIRTPVANISLLSRVTQGVSIVRLKGDDKISSIARIQDLSALVEDEEGDDPTEEEANENKTDTGDDKSNGDALDAQENKT